LSDRAFRGCDGELALRFAHESKAHTNRGHDRQREPGPDQFPASETGPDRLLKLSPLSGRLAGVRLNRTAASVANLRSPSLPAEGTRLGGRRRGGSRSVRRTARRFHCSLQLREHVFRVHLPSWGAFHGLRSSSLISLAPRDVLLPPVPSRRWLKIEYEQIISARAVHGNWGGNLLGA
jgi:hypothetical protein